MDTGYLALVFNDISAALPAPLFPYNIPGRTRNTIKPAAARKLAEHQNIVGIKDSVGSLESLRCFIEAVRDVSNLDVLSGPDHLA